MDDQPLDLSLEEESILVNRDNHISSKGSWVDLVREPLNTPTLIANAWLIAVGVSQHKYPKYYSPLPQAANDAYQMTEILLRARAYKREQTFLYLEETCLDYQNNKLLSDGLPDSGHILDALDYCVSKAGHDDLLFFYFSGHGVIHGSGSIPYLICRDSNPRSLNIGRGLPMHSVRELIDSSLAKVKVIIIDTCHSGGIMGRKSSDSMRKEFVQLFKESAQGLVLATSCDTDQYSFPHSHVNRSAFTHYIIETLKNEGWKKDKYVTADTIKNHVSEKVKIWSHTQGYPQIPQFNHIVDGDPIVADYRTT